MQVGQRIVLDFTLHNHIKLIAKQNDINSRFLIITLKNNRQSVIIPNECVATLNITRVDGSKKCYRASVANNMITAFLSDWAVELSGIIYCDVSIIENNEKLTTMPAKIDVVKACCTSDDIEDAMSDDIITQIINMLETYNAETEHLSQLDDAIETLNSTVEEHSTSINNIKNKRTTLTLLANNWILNQNTNLYEYTITDSNITANHYIDVVMDLANQAKLEDGYVESYDGEYIFYTSKAPTEDITVTVVISLTEEVS